MHPISRKNGCFTLSLLTAMITSSIYAQTGKFNPRFLEETPGIDQHLDLSIYDSKESKQLPGRYRVSVLVNEKTFDTLTLDFKAASDEQHKKTGESLEPCLSYSQLEAMGVRVESFPALKATPPESCVAFDEIIPSAQSHFDFNAQQLLLSFPQAAMNQIAHGTVPESRWDEGVPALLLNYDFSGSNNSYDQDVTRTYTTEDGERRTETHEKNDTTSSYYLNLRSGLNLGPWRLRNTSTWSRNDGEDQWDNIGTSLSRDIVFLKSQITLGDTYTASDIFDSVQMRGALLASDDEMLPDSRRGFAPIVRGIAKSNAEVIIEQNGYVIYRTFVQPGAFEINDLYPTSSSGDLNVTVREADGSEQKFIQPFSSVAIFQREGQLKYSLAAGEYRAGNYDSDKPRFGEINMIYGLPWGMTVYGGTQLSENYNAYALGLGKNFGHIGAISVDVTQANSKLSNGESDSGQSYRFLYSKSFAESGTDFQIMGYRYSTSGYYTFQEAADTRSDADSNYARYHKRSQIQGSVSQQLEGIGSLYVSYTQQDYWNDQGKQRSVSAGFNGRWGPVNYGISYAWNQNPDYDNDDRLLSFNISYSFGRMWSNYRVTTDQDGHTRQQVGLSGTLLEDHNLNYNLQEGYASNGEGNSGSVSMGYNGSVGNVTAGYNYDRNSQQINYGLRGGVVMHSEGITLGQSLGETIALVSAKGARGAKVLNNAGVSVDWMGNAIVPYATPYRETELVIRTETLNDYVDISSSTQRVVPTRGAVVRANFHTRVGYRVLMNLHQLSGKAVPFGATATLADEEAKDNMVSSIVGEDGQLYISGIPEKGVLQVSWGQTSAQTCRVNYALPLEKAQHGIVTLNADCQ